MLSKLAVLPAGLFFAAEILPKLVHGIFGYLVAVGLIAGGVAGTRYLWHLGRSGWRNAKAVAKRVVEIIEETPARLDRIERRLSDGEAHFARQDKRLDSIDKALDVIAEKERNRITDALARGEQRSAAPDRRHAA